MQTRHIWQGNIAHDFTVVGEWPEPTQVSATPVIGSYYFGITVGFFYRDQAEHGYWYSSNVTNLINAWRVAQILPRVKQLRNRGGGYDTTLCGLVIALPHTKRENRHDTRMYNRAKDLGVTVDELHDIYDEMQSRWPTAEVLERMLHKLPDKQIDDNSGRIRDAIESGKIESTPGLAAILDDSALRQRSKEEQIVYENELIMLGMDSDSYSSFERLLRDLGYTNLVYTVGCGDFGEPSHFRFDNLDRDLMREMIGSNGYSNWIPLLSTAKQPDDPSAHIKEGGVGFTVYMSDFGDTQPPFVRFGEEQWRMVKLRYDRVTERFLVTLRPEGNEFDDDDKDMTVTEIREEIGVAFQLGHPLVPATHPPYVMEAKNMQAAATDDGVRTTQKASKKNRWPFGRR